MTHLHVRSWFSFGAGASSPHALAQTALRHGQSALAITDLNTLAGAVRHAAACKIAGIKPLFGATLTVDGASLVLLCADHGGYSHLCDLLTLAHLHAADAGNRKQPGLEMHELQGRTGGLFCLTGGREGMLSRHLMASQWSQARQLVSTLSELFPQRLFIELSHQGRPDDNPRGRHLIELAQTLQVPTVASNAVRHASPRGYVLYDALTCVRLGLTIAQYHEDRPFNGWGYLCGEERLQSLGLPAASLANSDALARECQVDLMPGEVLPPRADLPEGTSATQFLKQLCVQGLEVRGMATSRAAKAQLRREVEVVSHLELEEFFLVVREVVAFSRSRGIRCSGRGSAANSLIAYLLGITEVDPLRHNLLFERFLHEGRRGMPDIDVDFESHRRGEVIAWMGQRWGEAHTAMTANVNTYRLRSAIRDIGKVLGYPLALLDQATKHLPHGGVRRAPDYRAELAETLGDGVGLDVLVEVCASLHDGEEACPRHLSLHSGGMVLSREPLRRLTPIQTSANGVRQMQFNKDDVERLGLIKFDVLGLRMLSVLTEAIQLLESVGMTPPDIDNLPEDDPATYKLIQAGLTLGIFQIESPGQWNLLARTQPENFDDLVVQVALFRPGPLQGGMVHPYVARRRGWAKVTYPHPSLEGVLRDTCGIILFQEQVLEVAHVFAGMNLRDADEFRRLMSKWRDPGEMEAMRGGFVQGAVSTHAGSECPVSLGLANAVFDLISKFVGYGFCRSHAAAFARIVYQSAYLKAHHPAAYLAGVLEHLPGFFPIHTLLEEARAFGVSVLPACILSSQVKYRLEGIGDEVAIRVPLTQIEQISPPSAARIVLERGLSPFESLDDLFRRVSLPGDAWDNLARSGALDAFGERRQVLWHLRRWQRLSEGKRPRAKQLSLLNQSLDQSSERNLDQTLPLDLPMERLLAFNLSDTEATRWDFATMSLTTGPHPMAFRRPDIAGLGGRCVEELFRMKPGSTVLVAGAVISRQRPPTAKGFCFIILEDETGRIPTAIAPGVYERFERVLRAPHLLIEGRLEAPNEERMGKAGTGKAEIGKSEIGKRGIYRSVLIEKIWVLDEVTGRARAVTVGSTGHPGENPRFATRALAGTG